MSFLISNQRDVVKQLQYVAEDSRTTPGNWGTTPPSSVFAQAGYNPRFTYTDQPEGVDVRILGSEGKTNKVKVGAAGLLDIRTNLTDATRTIARWVFEAAGGGADTIDDSFTFVESHRVLGTETYRVMRGCIPLNGTLNVPNRGLIELTCQILVTQPADEVTTTDGGLTTPVFVASQPVGPVWTHLNGGSQPLLLGGNKYRERGFSVSITRELSMLDSSGDTTAQFAKASRKVITGTITVFRIDSLNQTRTTALSEFTASRVLKTAISTITLTNFQIQTHPTAFDQESSDALMEELAFEATELAMT